MTITVLTLLLLPLGSALVIDVPAGNSLQAEVLALQDRILTEDTQVRLAPGMHTLSSPLVLGAHGAWRLQFTGDAATISGGMPLGNWTVSKACRDCWESPLPTGFNRSDIGSRMQMWRGDTRLTLARSAVKQYIHATVCFIGVQLVASM